MAHQELGPATDIPVGKMKSYKIGDESILVFHLQEGFFATQTLCPHTLAPLKFGKILDDCQIQCPLHRARFHIKSGAVLKWAHFPPGIQLLNTIRKPRGLKTYPVKLQAGKLFVRIEQAKEKASQRRKIT